MKLSGTPEGVHSQNAISDNYKYTPQALEYQWRNSKRGQATHLLITQCFAFLRTCSEKTCFFPVPGRDNTACSMATAGKIELRSTSSVRNSQGPFVVLVF